VIPAIDIDYRWTAVSTVGRGDKKKFGKLKK
jgi:hypothetical protein